MSIDITQYKDYREYIKELFLFNKKHQTKFSYQYSAKYLKVSRTYLSHIIEKKRHISLDKIPGLCKLFKLTSFEKQYLTFLVLKNTIGDKEMSDYFYGVLGTLVGQKNLTKTYREKLSDNDKAEHLLDGLSEVLAALTHFADFKNDEHWMQQRLLNKKISPAEIRKSFDQLLKTGQVVEKNGKYKEVNFIRSEPGAFNPEGFKVYISGHQQAIQAADQPLVFRPNNFFMARFAIHLDDAKKIFSLFSEFRDQALKIIETSKNPGYSHFK
ncbi:MAG: TIGR02147 family protein [Pseudobdellovibrionaceae bacterium]